MCCRVLRGGGAGGVRVRESVGANTMAGKTSRKSTRVAKKAAPKAVFVRPPGATFASVTDAPCKCGYLRRAADDPRLPIVFDKRTGEYQFKYREDDADGLSMLVIYHCPFCGGAAPKSKRALLFHVIPPDEERRLAALLQGITSIRAALRRLGKPEHDEPRGMGVQMPERAGSAPTMQWFRMLHYEGLSKVANVWITERADGRASWQLQGKLKKRRLEGAR